MIVNWVKENSTVLDLGCGDGTLLGLLISEKKVKGQGTEIDEQAIYKCVEKGLSVYHEDIETGIPNYESNTFDYVIMSGSLQQVKRPDNVINEALRVGNYLVVSFPNFAYYGVRFQILLHGKVPVTPSLPYEWYNSPNAHFLSILDFVNYCKLRGIKIEKAAYVNSERRVNLIPNFFAELAVFLLSKQERTPEHKN